jgi:AraC-like DNA-binding protein
MSFRRRAQAYSASGLQPSSAMTTFYRYFPVSRRDKKWGLYATTAGESRIAPHTPYPPCVHPKGYAFDWQRGRVLDCYALVYISSGRGIFESKPKFSAAIEPGNVFLLFPGVWHRYVPDAAAGWNEHWIGFDGEIARRWQKDRFISPAHPVIKLNTEDTILTTFGRIVQSVRANRPALQQILAGATANLMGLLYSAQQTPIPAENQNPSAIELAIARMHKDLSHPLEMQSLAGELGVSYSWFRKVFTTHTGLSPHQYLLELRIVSARNLLAETRLSIKQIALQTGFEDEHYFSRIFRQKMNFTPSKWRDRARRHQ